MRNLINTIWLAGCFLSLTACDSVRRLSIEVQKPAAVTLPVSAQNVLILNNAVPQPNTYGITQKFNKVDIKESCTIELDSTIWRTANIMARTLKSSNFFNSVALYKEPVRTDKEWLTSYPVPKSTQENLYKAADCDAFLTIDRLIFALKEEVKKNEDYTDPFPGYLTDLHLEATLTCSFYMQDDEEKPFKTISISDSLFFINGVENELPFIYKEIPEMVIAEICHNLGRKMAAYFFPTWEKADRLVFMNDYARMKEANVYSLSDNWAKAKELWLAEFESQKKPVPKARISSNIALAYEMTDDIETALDWAKKAKDFFELDKNQTQHEAEIQFIDEYISELETRIENNNLIDLQMGIE
jgi:hypothetical protein